MENTIKSFSDKIIEEHRRAIRKAMRQVAIQVEKDFKQQAKNCLDNYYKEFTPKVYERQENLLKNSIIPYKRYRPNEINIGVAFSTMNMKPYDDPYGTASKRLSNTGFTTLEDLVVGNAMEGIHGHPLVYTGKSIHETMQSFRDVYSVFFLDDYFVNAISQAISEI